jgi:hypothetical protein
VNQSLPFLYPMENEQVTEAIDNTARKLVDMSVKAFKSIFNRITGWEDMPPRQRFAYLAHQIRRYDQQLQAQIVQLDAQSTAIMASQPMTPEEGMMLQQQVMLMQQQREQIAGLLANPGVAFFTELSRIDAPMASEIATEYRAGLKTYGGAA